MPTSAIPVLRAVGTARPPHALTQDQAAAYLGAATGLTSQQTSRLARVLAQTGIDTRHSVLAEFSDPTLASAGIGFASTATRSALFRQHAPQLAHQAALAALDRAALAPADITHVITVSCTGMYAPGLEQDLANLLGLHPDAERTAINFMGCYAAFHALKQAHYIVRAQPEANVLLCCVELSSLHVHASISGDALAGNALFADGAAAAVVSASPAPAQPALQLHRFLSRVAPNSTGDMAWTIGDHGFDIQLSSYVPGLLQQGIGQLVTDLLRDRPRPAHWAIHPGGVKILQACEAALDLAEGDLAHSYAVLRDCGNMSSATILFVLDRLLRQSHLTSGQGVFACAFGPGLTMESLLAEVV